MDCGRATGDRYDRYDRYEASFISSHCDNFADLQAVKLLPLPGGYKVGDTVYSLISNTHSKDTNKSVVPGSKGKVTGRADEPNQRTEVEVRFESGWFTDINLESVTKTVPPPLSHSTFHTLALTLSPSLTHALTHSLYCCMLCCCVLGCCVLYCCVLYCCVLRCCVLHCLVIRCLVLYCCVLRCCVL